MTSVATTGGVHGTYTAPPITDFVDPTVLNLALEFLSGNTASAALKSLLGQTAAVVNTMQKRAKLLYTLQTPSALNDALQNHFGDLVGDMRSMALSFPSDPPSSADFSHLSGWIAALQADQAHDMAAFQQIKKEVGEGAGLLTQFVHNADRLLEQFAPAQPMDPNNVNKNPLDILHGLARDDSASRHSATPSSL